MFIECYFISLWFIRTLWAARGVAGTARLLGIFKVRFSFAVGRVVGVLALYEWSCEETLSDVAGLFFFTTTGDRR